MAERSQKILFGQLRAGPLQLDGHVILGVLRHDHVGMKPPAGVPVTLHDRPLSLFKQVGRDAGKGDGNGGGPVGQLERHFQRVGHDGDAVLDDHAADPDLFPIIIRRQREHLGRGEKIDQIILSILELVIMTGYLPREQKLPGLQKISTKLDLLKILLRLTQETKCLDNKKYQHLISQTIEIGKMLGGWIKLLR